MPSMPGICRSSSATSNGRSASSRPARLPRRRRARTATSCPSACTAVLRISQGGRVVVHHQHARPARSGARPERLRGRARCRAARIEGEGAALAAGSLSTPISPPISSTSRALIARPRPVPPYLRVVDVSACVNGWNSCSLLLGRHADAGVAHREAQLHRRRRAAPLAGASGTTSPRSVNLTALPTGSPAPGPAAAGRPPASAARRPGDRTAGRGPCRRRGGQHVEGQVLDARRRARTGAARGRACRPRSWRSRGCR